ncbi:hypothetical protein HPB49_003504 [Dermacentor silvarum]|uniref:Uncharacterized protein n=1 Tax=Dermacentor silvarum TaxID=543639 RepID=A0ACB8DN52_DERSI|nr:hypothetical protein HPB49_003504 [Dermacentor silvarum]
MARVQPPASTPNRTLQRREPPIKIHPTHRSNLTLGGAGIAPAAGDGTWAGSPRQSTFKSTWLRPVPTIPLEGGAPRKDIKLSLLAYIDNLEHPAAVLALQETGAAVKLKGFTDFHAALRIAGRDPLMIVGDFNAPCPMWGYRKEEPRGRKSARLISTLGITLLTDSVHPTRVENSVTRDTCPDLTLRNTSDTQTGSTPRTPSVATTAY